jgi:hypothetical protein
MDTQFQIIEKENIADLKFPHSEILNDDKAIDQRTTELKRALSLKMNSLKKWSRLQYGRLPMKA